MSQQQREQALLARRVAAVVGLMVAKGEVCSEPAPVITLARAATQKEALNTRSYNEGKKLVCKFCRQYAVNNSAQKGGRRWLLMLDLLHPLPQISFGDNARKFQPRPHVTHRLGDMAGISGKGLLGLFFLFPHKKGQHLDRDEICQTPAGSC